MKTGVRILVVDDEESVRGILSSVLTDDGHEVSEAASAEEALVLFKNDPFPIVFSDIRMPGMNGIQLLQEIKMMQPDTQVVIITSHASLDNAVLALRSGAYDYLIKPFEELDTISAAANRASDKIRLIVENRVLVEQLKNNNQELENVNRVLRELAIRDGLTGLYNHRYFQDALNMEVSRSRRHTRQFSLIFLDVDHFKHYNDTRGHPEGDRLLRILAQLIKERLRRSDMAARYGGEEFVMLLPETDQEGVRMAAEDLRLAVENVPFEGGEQQPLGKVTISIGVATFPDDATEGATLVQMVDQALYQAKRNGRNQVRSVGQ